MTDDAKDTATVTYRVSDLLDQIKIAQAQGFARLETNLSMKADKSDLAGLAGRIDKHDEKIGGLEQWRRDSELVDEATTSVQLEHTAKSWNWKRRTVAVLASIGMIVATVLGPYLAIHLHF